jgi:hypothetical protein
MGRRSLQRRSWPQVLVIDRIRRPALVRPTRRGRDGPHVLSPGLLRSPGEKFVLRSIERPSGPVAPCATPPRRRRGGGSRAQRASRRGRPDEDGERSTHEAMWSFDHAADAVRRSSRTESDMSDGSDLSDTVGLVGPVGHVRPVGHSRPVGHVRLTASNATAASRLPEVWWPEAAKSRCVVVRLAACSAASLSDVGDGRRPRARASQARRGRCRGPRTAA